MKRLPKFSILAIALPGLVLAGCGNSGPAAPKVDVKQYIVVSAGDCADNAGLDYDTCSTLLETAIAEHDTAAPTYKRLAACEKTEGADRCDRIGDDTYRARLSAFQITMTAKPTAAPLYPGKKATPGFRTASNTEISTEADAYTFTKSAADAASLFTGGGKKRKG